MNTLTATSILLIIAMDHVAITDCDNSIRNHYFCSVCIITTLACQPIKILYFRSCFVWSLPEHQPDWSIIQVHYSNNILYIIYCILYTIWSIDHAHLYESTDLYLKFQLFAWLLIQLISIICPDHSSTEKMAGKWRQILILGHHLLKDNTILTNFTITIKCLFMMLWLIAITCVSSHQMPDLLMSNTERNNLCPMTHRMSDQMNH